MTDYGSGAYTKKVPATNAGATDERTTRVVHASDDPLVVANTAGIPSVHRLLSSAASVNSTNVKGSAGAIGHIWGVNTNASPMYLKLYNKASAPTVGTDTPIATLYLPALTAFTFDIPVGLTAFTLGIGYGFTTASADNSTAAVAAGDIVNFHILYS
jgi:hypothetical protein